MERIRKAEIKDNMLILLAFGALLLLGIVVITFCLKKNIILVFFGVCITILGIFFGVKQLLKIRKGDLPLSNTLRKEPEKIVWVYSMVTQRMPFGLEINQSGMMYFKLIDGSELSVKLPATELKSISESLNDHLSHATFGYTEERAQWFTAHPAMLLKNQNSKDV